MKFSGLLLIVAGLSGFMGVASAAMAAHVDSDPYMALISQFMLVHGLLYVGMAAMVKGKQSFLAKASAGFLVVGQALFCGDLYSRLSTGERLFHFAAPFGGGSMMVGWLFLGIWGLQIYLKPNEL